LVKKPPVGQNPTIEKEPEDKLKVPDIEVDVPPIDMANLENVSDDYGSYASTINKMQKMANHLTGLGKITSAKDIRSIALKYIAR
jgi:hypothetical protein